VCGNVQSCINDITQAAAAILDFGPVCEGTGARADGSKFS